MGHLPGLHEDAATQIPTPISSTPSDSLDAVSADIRSPECPESPLPCSSAAPRRRLSLCGGPSATVVSPEPALGQPSKVGSRRGFLGLSGAAGDVSWSRVPRERRPIPSDTRKRHRQTSTQWWGHPRPHYDLPSSYPLTVRFQPPGRAAIGAFLKLRPRRRDRQLCRRKPS